MERVIPSHAYHFGEVVAHVFTLLAQFYSLGHSIWGHGLPLDSYSMDLLFIVICKHSESLSVRIFGPCLNQTIFL